MYLIIKEKQNSCSFLIVPTLSTTKEVKLIFFFAFVCNVTKYLHFLSCFPGVRRLPELDQRANANVHYTLLIACVLVAFCLGAILSGFLVSCYCSRSADHRARRLGKDPEASLPHALSLRSLAKLNGLLEGQPKVGARCSWITFNSVQKYFINPKREIRCCNSLSWFL